MRPTLLTLSWSFLLLSATALSADDAQVQKLIKDLGSADSEVFIEACKSLGEIGAEAKAAVPALTKSLESDNPKRRAYAAYGLGRIGKPAMSAADTLIDTAFDKDPLVRRASLRALRRIDPPHEKTMPVVIKILEEGDMSIIIPTLQSIVEEGKDSVPRLRGALKAKHPQVQYWACIVLAEIGPDAAAAVPEITEVLKARDPDTRLQALLALGNIGEAAEKSLGAILKVAENDDFEHVRYAAVYAIGNIGTNDAAKKSLQAWIKSDDEFLRTVSAWALGRTNSDNKELVKTAVNVIVEAFKSENVDVRRAAARAMVEFDVDREVVAPLLVKALSDKDETVVANAIAALSSLGPKALEHVDDALANKDLRHYALLLIGRLGPEAASAVPAIVSQLGKQSDEPEDLEFIREAHFALSAIGPAAKQAIPTLVKAISSEQDEVSASACYALGKMKDSARTAIPALQRAERSESLIVRATSVFALWQIQPGNPTRRIKASTLLLKAVDDERVVVRAGAATMLGELGRLSSRAKAKLEQLRDNDEAEIVRQAAAGALDKSDG
jgi:HEAT repeat protein